MNSVPIFDTEEEARKKKRPTQAIQPVAPIVSAPATVPAAPAGLRTEYDGSGIKTITDGTNTLKTSALTPTGTAVRPATGPVRTNVAGLAANPNVQGATVGNGYTFHGSAGDAARFMEPTGVNEVTMRAMQNQFARMNPAAPAPAKQVLEAPKYLGPESGLGWKTRLGKYKEELDAYNKATGNQTVLDVNAMQEAGAGQRAAMVADTANANIVADAPLKAAQIGKFKEDAGLAALKADLQRQMLDPNTTPEARQRVEKTFAALHGTAAPKNQILPGQKISTILPGGGLGETVTPPQIVDPTTGVYRDATKKETAVPVRTPTPAEIAKMQANAKDPKYQEYWKKNFGDAKY